MNLAMVEPIDPVHRASVAARAKVNELFGILKDRAAKWEPAPMPTNWQPQARQLPPQSTQRALDRRLSRANRRKR